MKHSGHRFTAGEGLSGGRTLPDLLAAAALAICAAFIMPAHDSLLPTVHPLHQDCLLQIARISLIFAALYFVLRTAAPNTARLRASSRAMGSRMIAPLRWTLEAVRGVPVSTGTLDLMVEAGWVAPRGRKDAPGRPVMWGTTAAFLDHFALTSLDDLPRLDELEGAGLFKPLRAAPEPDEPETDDADDGAHPGEPAPS